MPALLLWRRGSHMRGCRHSDDIFLVVQMIQLLIVLCDSSDDVLVLAFVRNKAVRVCVEDTTCDLRLSRYREAFVIKR